MGKHWAREQVRRNELQDGLQQAAEWVAVNRRSAGWIAGGVLFALIAVAGVFLRRSSARDAAWEQFGLAQAMAYSGQVDQALQSLQSLAEQYPGSQAAGYGLLFAGDIQFPRGRYPEALEAYQKVAESGSQPQRPLALANIALTQESAGQYGPAAESANRFLDAYPDHFLAPQVHASLARSLQAQGQNEQAKAALQKIAIQYADTSWAAWAQSKVKGG